MVIDENKFKQSLSSAFIELLDSKRGVAAELGRAINKPGSFINEVKRGKPVNSLHLKAVGLVFGAQKVLDLLALNDDDNDLLPDDCKNGYSRNPNRVIVLKHQDLISRFKNPEKGLKNNEYLIGIEDASEDLYKKVSDYLQTTHETAKILKNELQKKTSSIPRKKARKK